MQVYSSCQRVLSITLNYFRLCLMKQYSHALTLIYTHTHTHTQIYHLMYYQSIKKLTHLPCKPRFDSQMCHGKWASLLMFCPCPPSSKQVRDVIQGVWCLSGFNSIRRLFCMISELFPQGNDWQITRAKAKTSIHIYTHLNLDMVELSLLQSRMEKADKEDLFVMN